MTATRAGAVMDPDSRGLRTFTALLWDSVARVADGEEPDVEDKAVFAHASKALLGQVDLLRFVSDRASGLPTPVVRNAENLVELVWYAADVVGEPEYTRDAGLEGIEELAATLAQMSEGDRQVAQDGDDLWHRVALLTTRSAV